MARAKKDYRNPRGDKLYIPRGADFLAWTLYRVANQTPAEIARATGVSRTTVMGWLNGHSSPRKPTELLMIARLEDIREELKAYEKVESAEWVHRHLFRLQETIKEVVDLHKGKMVESRP